MIEALCSKDEGLCDPKRVHLTGIGAGGSGCWGLGAALVDGRVTPDRYRLGSDGGVTSTRIGTKRFKVTEDLIDPAGTRLENVPRHLQRARTLTGDQVEQVAKLAADCEAHFGAPQDVEWAIAGGKLHLLQSRPITTAPPARAEVDGRWVIFQPIVENFTGAMITIAKDVKIQVEFDPSQVLRYRLLGYENRAVADADFRNDAVDAGEVGVVFFRGFGADAGDGSSAGHAVGERGLPPGFPP